MKPFDLEKALAGGKVVTRDGREVTGLHRFDGIGEDAPYELAGVSEGELRTWMVNGRFHVGTPESGLDLFMAPKPKLTRKVVYWTVFERGEWCMGFTDKASARLLAKGRKLRRVVVEEPHEVADCRACQMERARRQRERARKVVLEVEE